MPEIKADRISFRISPPLRSSLVRAAKKHNRTLSQEATARMESSFAKDAWTERADFAAFVNMAWAFWQFLESEAKKPDQLPLFPEMRADFAKAVVPILGAIAHAGPENHRDLAKMPPKTMEALIWAAHHGAAQDSAPEEAEEAVAGATRDLQRTVEQAKRR